MVQHLTVARVAEGLAVSWNTANDAPTFAAPWIVKPISGSAWLARVCALASGPGRQLPAAR